MNDNVIPLQRPDVAARQAQEWVIRIDAGRLSAQDRQALQAWLAADERHATLLDTHALLWCEAVRATFPPGSGAASGAAAIIYPTGQGLRTGSPLLARTLLAGSRSWYLAGLLSLGLLWLMWDVLPHRLADPLSQLQSKLITSSPSMTTAIGQQREMPLLDGSHVHLNTASAIEVTYSKERRRIVLNRGEALFDVAKDAERPFEVVAGTTTVRAIGTRFTVLRLADGRTEITVFEGVVEVVRAPSWNRDGAVNELNGPRQPLRLSAGQTLTIQPDKMVIQQLAKSALEHKLAWREERIVFDDVSLGEAVAQVNRYSQTALKIADPALMDLHVSGAFSTADVPVFIRSLEQGFGLQVAQTAEGYRISQANQR